LPPQPDGIPEATSRLPAQYEPPAAPQPQTQYSPPPGPYQPPVGGPHQPPQSLPLQALRAGPVLVTVGDISVEQHRIVTPAGVMPTQGTNWSAMDMSRTEEKIPAGRS
jgi:hypothetical protein